MSFYPTISLGAYAGVFTTDLETNPGHRRLLCSEFRLGHGIAPSTSVLASSRLRHTGLWEMPEEGETVFANVHSGMKAGVSASVCLLGGSLCLAGYVVVPGACGGSWGRTGTQGSQGGTARPPPLTWLLCGVLERGGGQCQSQARPKHLLTLGRREGGPYGPSPPSHQGPRTPSPAQSPRMCVSSLTPSVSTVSKGGFLRGSPALRAPTASARGTFIVHQSCLLSGIRHPTSIVWAP